jgi:hypothetical protein
MHAADDTLCRPDWILWLTDHDNVLPPERTNTSEASGRDHAKRTTTTVAMHERPVACREPRAGLDRRDDRGCCDGYVRGSFGPSRLATSSGPAGPCVVRACTSTNRNCAVATVRSGRDGAVHTPEMNREGVTTDHTGPSPDGRTKRHEDSTPVDGVPAESRPR